MFNITLDAVLSFVGLYLPFLPFSERFFEWKRIKIEYLLFQPELIGIYFNCSHSLDSIDH